MMSAMRSRTLLACLLAALLSACRPSGSLPEEFLGSWYFTGSSGGLDGRGGREDPTHRITMRAQGMDVFDATGTLLQAVAFEVGRARTIFSTEEQWVLRSEAGVEVLQLSDDGRSLTLAQDVYDGLCRHFARTPAGPR